MASLDDVYRKFGETAEAAQLLETELGNILMLIRVLEENLIIKQASDYSFLILEKINKNTLGQLLKQIGRSTDYIDVFALKLEQALKERNRLSHSFYREHNFRRNTDEGRAIMLEDLEKIHEVLLDAYRAVLSISNVNLDNNNIPLPKKHLKL